MTRKTLTLSTEITKPQVENEYEATLLAPGTHNGWTFLSEDIARAVESMEGQPVNLNHSRDVEDEVGFIKGAKAVEGRLRGTIVLEPKTSKFPIAKAFIETRQRAGKAPEVSVGVSFIEEVLENGTVLARDLQFDHLALVTRGACSPEKGCGVGLSQETPPMPEPEDTTPPTAEGEGAAPAPDAEAAPAATPAPEPDATPSEAPLSAEKPPCGCHELEALLLAEKEKVTRLEGELAAETKARSELASSLPERLTLLAKAREFGLEMTGTEDLAVMRADLAKAERVAAHLAARNAPAPATGPAPAPARSQSALAQDDVGRKAAAMLRAGGLDIK